MKWRIELGDGDEEVEEIEKVLELVVDNKRDYGENVVFSVFYCVVREFFGDCDAVEVNFSILDGWWTGFEKLYFEGVHYDFNKMSVY